MNLNDSIQWTISNYEWLSILAIVISFTILSMRYFRSRDREDPESVIFLIIAVLLGVISVIPAIILSLLLSLFVPDTLNSVLVAPIAEELAKGFFVALIARTRLIRDPLDGLIYGAMIGTGFAAIENFLYAFDQVGENGLFSGLFLASFRSIFIVIGHPLYTGITGYGMGIYKMGLGTKWDKLWIAIFMHSVWNGTSVFFVEYWIISFFIVIIISIMILRIYVRRAQSLDQ